MLLRNVEVGFRNLCGQQEPIMLHTSGFSELLEPFRTEHLA